MSHAASGGPFATYALVAVNTAVFSLHSLSSYRFEDGWSDDHERRGASATISSSISKAGNIKNKSADRPAEALFLVRHRESAAENKQTTASSSTSSSASATTQGDGNTHQKVTEAPARTSETCSTCEQLPTLPPGAPARRGGTFFATSPTVFNTHGNENDKVFHSEGSLSEGTKTADSLCRRVANLRQALMSRQWWDVHFTATFSDVAPFFEARTNTTIIPDPACMQRTASCCASTAEQDQSMPVCAGSTMTSSIDFRPVTIARSEEEERRKKGRCYTLATCNFMHATLTHFGFNVLTLLFLGRDVEFILGPQRFLGLFLGSATASSAAQVLYLGLVANERGTRCLGSSGGVCSLLAFAAVVAPTAVIYWCGFVPIPLWVCLTLLVSADVALPLLCPQLERFLLNGNTSHIEKRHLLENKSKKEVVLTEQDDLNEVEDRTISSVSSVSVSSRSAAPGEDVAPVRRSSSATGEQLLELQSCETRAATAVEPPAYSVAHTAHLAGVIFGVGAGLLHRYSSRAQRFSFSRLSSSSSSIIPNKGKPAFLKRKLSAAT
ncbi:unnamed protein product [Amoebophrya sp. A25]|nr:unnamed protein product [Amoebophrya sp. A25]|eukprot:GSA25T00010464001.1